MLNLHKIKLLSILFVSSNLYSQSITSSYFLSGGTTSSNGNYGCYSILGEPLVGVGSNGTYQLLSGSEFVKSNFLTGIDDHQKPPLPIKYALANNYPNPFNPWTTIEFSVPTSSHVSIAIFSTLGIQIRMLVDGHYNPGRYLVTWDASSFPSGVYFCRILSQNFVDTKRLVLLK